MWTLKIVGPIITQNMSGKYRSRGNKIYKICLGYYCTFYSHAFEPMFVIGTILDEFADLQLSQWRNS